ncbi:hypothetical protein NF27_BW00040 [Candidatus Jidaibacter acanthamoeba]|uniref:Ribbon-helix-helix protein CopG domain-containing protein n=1 Tax=Candidatus Jidaibacter acanthamoebae TaxID=86105 RepID=A0A0C1MV74_9RICK|nr:ribbon-helix-helix protein, CopG family [Candidatus Jidaibacter acanthamoeba]KIE06057.1 hypothetical protein NF27_BW00040 [Candidatus Jidaibacter acanthamoeba]
MSKEQKKIRVTISVPPMLMEELDKIINDEVLTKSQFILMALKEKIDTEKAKKELRIR